jgi:hypothetical protein
MARDEYVEQSKQGILDHLDRGDLKNAVASIISNRDADCKLPHHLARLAFRC